MKKWVALALMLGVMGLIFLFSSQPGASSGALSEAVANTIRDNDTTAWLLPAWFSGNLYANVRKWAHVYIYTALGATTAATVRLWLVRWPLWRQAVLAAGICLAFAASDECHQFFVPGRAMLLSDVGVDAIGFLPGIAVCLLVFWLLQRRRHRDES